MKPSLGNDNRQPLHIILNILLVLRIGDDESTTYISWPRVGRHHTLLAAVSLPFSAILLSGLATVCSSTYL